MTFAPALLTLLALGAAPTEPAAGGDSRGWVRPEIGSLRTVVHRRFSVDLGEFRFLEASPEEWVPPFISGDRARVYAATARGTVDAHDLASGDRLWRRTDLGALTGTLVEHRDELLLCAGSALLALDQATGTERWRLALDGHAGGALTVTGTVALIPVRPNAVVAVELAAHPEVGRVKRPTPDAMTLRGQARATVDPARGQVYLGFSDGVIQAVGLADGAARWSAQLGRPREFFADVDAAPVLVEDGKALVAASANGGLHRLDPATGQGEWARPHQGIVALTRLGDGGLAASFGDGRVAGISPRDGAIRWQYRLDRGWPAEPVSLGHGLIAVASSDSALVVLEARTGRPVQVVRRGAGASAPPAFRSPDLALLSNRGLLSTYRLATGP